MKRIARILAIVVAVLLLALVSLPFLISANQFRPRLETELSQALGRQVKLGDLRLAILSGGVTANDLSIADDPSFSRSPFLQARSLAVNVELWPLVSSRKLKVRGLTIEEPAIVLLQSPAGNWNFSSLGAKPGARPAKSTDSSGSDLDLSVDRVKISGGRISLGKTAGGTKPVALEKVDLELRDFTPASAFPFSLSARVAGGGDLQIEGKAGPLQAADAARTPLQLRLDVKQLDLVESGLVAPATGMGGLVSLAGTGSSNGRSLRLNGSLKAEQFRLGTKATPAKRPVQFDFDLEHVLERHAGSLSRGNVHIGKAVASLTGTYSERGDAAFLNMNLTGTNMPIPDLAEMLPSLGVVLPAGSSLQGGVANVRLAMEGPTTALVTSGSAGLANTKLAGFNLGSKIATVQSLAGIRGGPDTEIQTLSSDVRLAPEGSSLQAIKVVAPAIGELDGGGTVSPSGALDFKMRATLHTSGNILAALGQKGDTSVPFLIVGTASEPVFRPDVKGIATEQIKGLAGGDAGKAAGGFLRGLLGGKKPK